MLQSLVTAVVTVALGCVTLWIRDRLRLARSRETLRDQKTRGALERMLNVWSERVSFFAHRDKSFEISSRDMDEMSRQIVIWAPDDVLVEYVAFLHQRYPDVLESIQDQELPFGRVILAFRKRLGFKNKGDRLTPKQILAVFKAGWKTTL